MFSMSLSRASTIAERALAKISPVYARRPLDMVESVEDARKAWHLAQRELDFIYGEMTDHVIFKINATERRYVALLQQARAEGVAAWLAADLKPVDATGDTSPVAPVALCKDQQPCPVQAGSQEQQEPFPPADLAVGKGKEHQ